MSQSYFLSGSYHQEAFPPRAVASKSERRLRRQKRTLAALPQEFPYCTCNVHAVYVSSLLTSLGNSPQFAPKFEHRDNLVLSKAGELQTFLRSISSFDKNANPTHLKNDLVLCLIESLDPDSVEALRREFPSFPAPLLSYMAGRSAFAPGSSLTPEWRNSSGLSFVENYLRVDDRGTKYGSEAELPGYNLGYARIRSMPLVVWTGGTLAHLTISGATEIPMIFVIGDWDVGEVMTFVRACESNYGGETRLQRLAKCREWIYHDLYSTFSDWIDVWDTARAHLGDLDRQVHAQIGTSNILERMRRLNKATAANIMLREARGTQARSFEIVKSQMLKASTRQTGSSALQEDFRNRCTEVLQALDHYSVLARGNQEQLQNLMSMMVSLEQISQGQSSVRLNILAFTFLPLSFAATVFGMTQFTISSIWYPALALPMLIITALVAFLMPQLLSRWDHWRRPDSTPSLLKDGRDRNLKPVRGRTFEKSENGSVFKHRRRSSSLHGAPSTETGSSRLTKSRSGSRTDRASRS